MYNTHHYPPNCVWNIDEIGCQATQSDQAKVFSKRGVRGVHKIVLGEREWLSLLSAINASGQTIPNYYIFKGIRKLRNYTMFCEEGAMLGMQKKGWMDSTHFMEWMDFFVHRMIEEGRQPPQERHLVILDGHKSHISLEVLMKAKENGIDMISLPSHTSRELQSLDNACFKPFKVAFRAYRDLWALKHQGQKCRKKDLAQWASLTFKKALTKKNIMSGFRATWIWPLNPQALQIRTGPSEGFAVENTKEEQRGEIFEEGMPNPRAGVTHYYGTKEDNGLQELEEESEAEPESEPPTVATTNEDHIS